MKIKLWDKKENIILMNGEECTPEQIYANPTFAFAKHVPTVLTMSGPLAVSIDNLYILMDMYDIPEDTDPEEALALIVAAKAEEKEAGENSR